MAKNKSAVETKAAKKPAAKKAAAPAKGKKPPPAAKPSAKKAPPAKKPAGKKPAREESTQAELPIVEAAASAIEAIEEAAVEAIEDAEIVGENVAAARAAAREAIDADIAESEAAGEAEDDKADLTPEEQELSSLYGDDLKAPAVAHREFSDRQTADEDRPMSPELTMREERKQQWQERRDRRRQRRDERNQQRHERQAQHQQGGQRPAHGGGGPRPDRPDRPDRPERTEHREHRPSQGPANAGSNGHAAPPRPATPAPNAPATTPPAAPNGHDHDALARVGTPLGDAAATVFAQLRNGQPLPVKQLAAMMRKRSLIEHDPEQVWPQLKAELLGDERSYRTLGLRPRIVYRGRDLFAPGPVAMSQTADAEANVAAALSRLAGATHRALAARIARATGQGFERLIHAYLVAAGFREIAWVKRVSNISYAQAIAPGIDRMVLISARSGDQPIDRRGIGELRVGVEAKDLVAGILFSARELSEDAERELERAGRSISVMCGDQLVAALIAAGVGVVSSAAPIHYVDDQLLDELLAG